MVKYLLNFLFAFLILSSFSFAKDIAKYQEEFGRDLTHVPYVLRFAFQERFNKNWKDSDYNERLTFLADYETNLTKEKKQEKAYVKAQTEKDKERFLKRKAILRRDKDRLRAKIAEEKQEKLENKERQKQFDTSVRDQEKQLKDMEQESREE